MKEDFRNWSFAYRNRTKRKTKNWRVSSFFFSSSFFPSVGTQSREKSMPVRKQWRGHAYICPVNAIQLYSHVSIPDCALFILLNDTWLGRNGVRHPYPPRVMDTWNFHDQVLSKRDRSMIKLKWNHEMKRWDRFLDLFENVLNNSVKLISDQFSWPNKITKWNVGIDSYIILFENVLNNSVKSISISEVTNNFEGLIENKRG